MRAVYRLHGWLNSSVHGHGHFNLARPSPIATHTRRLCQHQLARGTCMWKRNGLSIVLLGLMLLFLCGQVAAGLQVQNQELLQHGRAPLDVWQ